jgi:membrane protein implicated in regulation of membrane protease activity
MFETVTYWHWVGIAALFLIAELLIGAEFMLWLAAAAVFSAIVAFVAPELSLWIQLVLFAVFCVSTLIAWAKLSFGRKSKPTDQPNLNKRQNQYVGRTFSLVQAIEAGEGKIKVDDSQWTVRGEDAKKGSAVKVVGVDGMTLLVEKS